MPVLTISEAIAQLEKYKDAETDKVDESITQLTALSTLSEIEINQLTNQLTALIDNESLGLKNIIREGISLDQALYNALLALAAAKPFNETDPITQEKIPAENRVVTSERHQFDIVALAEWRRHRGDQNPMFTDGRSFKPRDIATIQQMTTTKELKSTPAETKPSVDTTLLAGALSGLGVSSADIAAAIAAESKPSSVPSHAPAIPADISFSPVEPAIPLEVQALSDLTGLTVEYLMEAKAESKTAESKTGNRYDRIKKCKFYLSNKLDLNNKDNNVNPHAAMTLEEVLATSVEQSINLRDNYEEVLAERLTLDQAKDFSAEQAEAYLVPDRKAISSLLHLWFSNFLDMKISAFYALPVHFWPMIVQNHAIFASIFIKK